MDLQPVPRRYHSENDPYQSLWGRPYKGRITGFGKTVFELHAKAVKYKPGWRRGAWLGKDSADVDLISTDG